MKPLPEELPVAMVNYLAGRVTRVSTHAPCRKGMKFKARARRRGTLAKIVRRRQFKAERENQAAKSKTVNWDNVEIVWKDGQ